MSRRGAVVGALAVSALGVAAAVWLARRDAGGPEVVAPGQPLPFDREVALRFRDDETGDEETWRLEKRETTREESLGGAARALPAPDPAPADRAVDESARALEGLGRDAWRAGEIETALTHLESAVDADPDDWVPRASYGRLLTLVHDYGAAAEQLERAAELAPDDPQRWLDLQSLYERQVDLERALAARRRAEALAGGAPIRKDWAGQWVVEGAEPLP